MMKREWAVPEGYEDMFKRNVTEWALTARVPEHYINYFYPDAIEEDERCWYKAVMHRLHDGKSPGLAYVGKGWEPPVPTRMQAVAGWLVRNFKDARFYELSCIEYDDLDWMAPTLLFIPDLHLVTKDAAWRKAERGQLARQVLMGRSTKTCLTVVYIENYDTMLADYGANMKDVLDRFDMLGY